MICLTGNNHTKRRSNSYYPNPESLLEQDRLDTVQAAFYIHPGFSPRTLEKYRLTGDGPKYLKLGRRVYYRKADLDDWLNSKSKKSTSA